MILKLRLVASNPRPETLRDRLAAPRKRLAPIAAKPFETLTSDNRAALLQQIDEIHRIREEVRREMVQA